MECHDVWTSQFSFLHSLEDVFPPSETCLYHHINWSLAQAQQQSSMGLSQSFPSKRGGNGRSWTGFHFTVQKRPMLGSSGAYLAKRPHLKCRTVTHPGGKKSAGGSVSTSSADARKMGAMGFSTADVSQSTVHSLIIILIFSFSGWYAFPFWVS